MCPLNQVAYDKSQKVVNRLVEIKDFHGLWKLHLRDGSQPGTHHAGRFLIWSGTPELLIWSGTPELLLLAVFKLHLRDGSQPVLAFLRAE